MANRLGVMFMSICVAGAVAGPSASHNPSTAPAGIGRVFTAGGSAGATVITPWENTELNWILESEAGPVARGQARTDNQGSAVLQFKVPDVRVTVRLAGLLVTTDRSQRQAFEIVVLPKDPFADFRRKLEKLRVSLAGDGPLSSALQRNGLSHQRLGDINLVRQASKGDVIILAGMPEKSVAATRKWIDQLPVETYLIVVNDWSTNVREVPLSMIDWLMKAEPAKPMRFFVDKQALLWTDLPADWLGGPTAPPAQLVTPRNLTSLRIFAGYFSDDGAGYPLAMEATDIGGRWWLVWNLSAALSADDPRWNLLLRNSLLWASAHTASLRGEGSSTANEQPKVDN